MNCSLSSVAKKVVEKKLSSIHIIKCLKKSVINDKECVWMKHTNSQVISSNFLDISLTPAFNADLVVALLKV